jgi:hypothetical protein
MKNNLSRRFFAAVVLLLACVLTSCVTYRQVKQIVADSNAAILAHQLNGDVDPIITADGKVSDNAFESASARIESFIAAHPDQKTTAAALRIRQAMLFLAAGKPELARAAFNAADTNFLFTARDQTLAAMSPHLVWWFPAARRDANWSGDDRTNKAPAALAKLRELQSKLTDRVKQYPENEGIRDYVAETRVWIGLKKASSHADLSAARASFEDALTFYYTNVFNATDVALLKCHCCAESPKDLPPALRRCFRSEVLFDYAKTIWRQKTNAGPFEPTLPEDLKSLVKPGP